VQEPGYLEATEERFGYYDQAAAAVDGNIVWLHAVSLGETRAAAQLVAALRTRLPGMRLLLTHGTATGRMEGRKLLQSGDLQCWQPWDTSGATARFIEHFRPRIGILMETEIWPNLVAACTQAGVPVVLANARLSEKSLRWSRRLAWLARPAYRSLAAVWAQTQDDASRLAAMGAPVQGVLGNLKFDATPDAAQLAWGQSLHARAGRPVIMFASSREGEEAALLQALAAPDLAQAANAVQWLVVPRHPQRFEEVAKLMEQQGFGVSRRSQWADGPRPGALDKPTIWLGDTLGEMALYYALADVALLGGSFEPLGGQNLIEAAACACPVVMGPHTFNFAEAAELACAAGAAQRAVNVQEAVLAALALAMDVQGLLAARQAANAFAQSHQGASERLATAIARLLK
jgi:3-deoxy-D-manno-octulosonic-acid transferase